jgi:hypothetical protein
MYATEVYNMLLASAQESEAHAKELTAKAEAAYAESTKLTSHAAYHATLAKQYKSLAIQVEQANLTSASGAHPNPPKHN